MDHLLTEARNPASTNLDDLTPLQFVRLMNEEDRQVIPAVASQAEAIAQAIEIITDRFRAGGRLVYAGAGTSGRLGVLDASECPPTFNSTPGQVVGLIAGGPKALTQAVEGAEDHPEFAAHDLAAIDFSARDVLVGIATSGRTPYVLGAVAYAKMVGAFTAGLSCHPESELAALVDLDITVAVGPEVLTGSTRLKAGTATKLVLNMLTTGAMVRLGKTFGNLMVDLRATNTKLRARTNRIVRILTGISAPEADLILEQCGGELKTALVAQLAHLSPELARQRLRDADGQVRHAIPALAKAPRGQPYDGTLLIGIDGGGSHTVAVVATTTRGSNGTLDWLIVGRGEAGPCNHHAVGKERAFAALDQAVETAFANANIRRRSADATCLGLAGVDRADDLALVREWTEKAKLAGHVEITNDAALLLAAGTPQGWGLAIVAGTGSIAFGRTPDGRIDRAGGWGYILGDEGSAYGIVTGALRASARAVDQRGAPTVLLERFLKKLDLQKPSDLIPTIYGGGWDRARLATLAPLVMEAATTDEVARDIVADAATELALAAATVARKLGMTDRPLPLAVTGGVVLANASYREQIVAALKAMGIDADPVTAVTEPAEGAVRIALNQIHFIASLPR
jgi:N-acetylmuramic acid 6-phosphate etherase